MKTKTYRINCALGSSRDWPFSNAIQEELNQIGYSGTLNGKKTTLHEYLGQMSNSKVSYNLIRTGGNGFECTDEYLLTITEAGLSDQDLNTGEEAVIALAQALNLSEKQVIEILEGGMLLETRGKLTSEFKEFLDEMTATFNTY